MLPRPYVEAPHIREGGVLSNAVLGLVSKTSLPCRGNWLPFAGQDPERVQSSHKPNCGQLLKRSPLDVPGDPPAQSPVGLMLSRQGLRGLLFDMTWGVLPCGFPPGHKGHPGSLWLGVFPRRPPCHPPVEGPAMPGPTRQYPGRLQGVLLFRERGIRVKGDLQV
ncbi:hypothetical protein GWK47_038034 [Chionoecetes opilio]|uniref:Uncharacterized protein n=1 Tax=Chionoecetes opilio TaxID=41210 RepID=A0A8J4YEE2_CHIOP|nr:hypothetical protein GWK47_038034 [Chionoecetes opilio]